MLHHRTGRGRAALALGFIALVAGCDAMVAAPPTAQVAAIRIAPSSINVTVGADSQLVAVVTDAAGTVLSGQDVRWNTMDGSVLSVSQTGVVHAISMGTAGVSAVTGTHLAMTTVTVIPAPPAHN